MTTRRFHLDRRAGKLLGVCAGIARTTALDVTLVRVAMVLFTLTLLHGAGVAAYLLIGLVADDLPRGH